MAPGLFKRSEFIMIVMGVSISNDKMLQRLNQLVLVAENDNFEGRMHPKVKGDTKASWVRGDF